jgi:DegV family protein with EDD domain
MNTQKIGLIADGVADLPAELTQRFQIEVVPVKMDWPELESVSGDNIFMKMREFEKKRIQSFGKTSQPSPKDFLIAYRKQLGLFEKIVCITVTSKLSGTHNSAIQAKDFLTEEEKERVFVIDSLNASVGEGLSTIKALDLIEKGKSAEEIAKELETFIPEVKLYGLFLDPKWLEASGRLPHAAAEWVRKVQKVGLYPLLGIKEGLLKPIGIKMGVKDLPSALFNEVEGKTRKLRKQGKKIKIAVAHGDNLQYAEQFRTMVEEKMKGTELVFISLVDNILAVLVGPDALIAAWAEF